MHDVKTDAATTASTTSSDVYSGVDNLEVMQEAVNYNRYLLDTVRGQARRGMRVLDFGAGTGTFALPMAESGFEVCAIEPDEILRDRLQARGLATTADVATLPDDRFNYAYTLNVLEHIEADTDALRHLFTKLEPGGPLLVYVPAFPLLYTSMDTKVGHVRRYTRGVLVKRVRSAGFEIDRVRYVDCLGFTATLLFKLLGNSSGDVNRPLLRLYDRWFFPASRLLDTITGRWFGKNLLLIAHKPG